MSDANRISCYKYGTEKSLRGINPFLILINIRKNDKIKVFFFTSTWITIFFFTTHQPTNGSLPFNLIFSLMHFEYIYLVFFFLCSTCMHTCFFQWMHLNFSDLFSRHPANDSSASISEDVVSFSTAGTQEQNGSSFDQLTGTAK